MTPAEIAPFTSSQPRGAPTSFVHGRIVQMTRSQQMVRGKHRTSPSRIPGTATMCSSDGKVEYPPET